MNRRRLPSADRAGIDAASRAVLHPDRGVSPSHHGRQRFSLDIDAHLHGREVDANRATHPVVGTEQHQRLADRARPPLEGIRQRLAGLPLLDDQVIGIYQVFAVLPGRRPNRISANWQVFEDHLRRADRNVEHLPGAFHQDQRLAVDLLEFVDHEPQGKAAGDAGTLQLYRIDQAQRRIEMQRGLHRRQRLRRHQFAERIDGAGVAEHVEHGA
ncbi:hypothetical protein D3C87_1233430 [compost metagenome]